MLCSKLRFGLRPTAWVVLIAAGVDACSGDEATSERDPKPGRDAGPDVSIDGVAQPDAADARLDPSDASLDPADADLDASDASAIDPEPWLDAGGRQMRWLAFGNSVGVYVFDLERYPYDYVDPLASEIPTTITLAEADATLPASPWSPDSERIMYLQSGTLYVRDMNGPTPSEPRKMADAVVTGSPAWSSDSTSIAYVSNGELFVRDPAGAPEDRITTGVREFAWSRQGSWLLYTTEQGLASVVYVQNGVGRSEKHVWMDGDAATPSRFAWSPDGNIVARIAPDSTIQVIDLRWGRPQVLRSIPPSTPNPHIWWVGFDAMGFRVAYAGAHESARHDLRYLSISGSSVELEPAFVDTSTYELGTPMPAWSPQGSWITFFAGSELGADLSGRTASAPVSMPGTWLPDSSLLHRIRLRTETVGLRVYSPGFPGADPVTVDDPQGIGEVALRPGTITLAYSCRDRLKTVYLNRAASGSVQPRVLAVLPPSLPGKMADLRWSGDGRFLATRVELGADIHKGYQLVAVMAAKNRATLSPVVLQTFAQMTDTVTFAWQY